MQLTLVGFEIRGTQNYRNYRFFDSFDSFGVGNIVIGWAKIDFLANTGTI